jgi:cytochrome oxidase Cu insertion factor (SCO1/SenC/PrrC family)
MAAAVVGLFLLKDRKPDAPPESASDTDLVVPAFALTERSGETVRRDDLLGKVWVTAFTFTRCAGQCTQISGVMAHLQHDLADQKDVVLVSITVDPEYDTPKVLRAYADRFKADPHRWLFLTGEPDTVYRLIEKGFRIGAQPNTGAERTPGNEVKHDFHMAVVDRRGHIRAYVAGTAPDAAEQLETHVKALLREGT